MDVLHDSLKKGIVSIDAEFTDGYRVVLEKEYKRDKTGLAKVIPNTASYKVFRNGNQQHIFTNFGQTVPEEVQAVLEIGDINVQGQLDQHFLITSSGGDVARTINKITKLENVDKWTSELTTNINTTSKIIKRTRISNG